MAMSNAGRQRRFRQRQKQYEQERAKALKAEREQFKKDLKAALQTAIAKNSPRCAAQAIQCDRATARS